MPVQQDFTEEMESDTIISRVISNRKLPRRCCTTYLSSLRVEDSSARTVQSRFAYSHTLGRASEIISALIDRAPAIWLIYRQGLARIFSVEGYGGFVGVLGAAPAPTQRNGQE